MNGDLVLATTDNKTETITFDMQKTLQLSRLSTNIILYKRKSPATVFCQMISDFGDVLSKKQNKIYSNESM